MIKVPVFPFALSDRSGIPEDQIQTCVSRLLAAFALGSLLTKYSPICCQKLNGSPIVGYFSDRAASRKLHYLLGLGSLIFSTALVATARIYWLLLAARVLQGCSSAVVWTVGMALLADTLPTNQLGVAMGTIGSVVSLAMVSAPVLGGTLFHHFGYEAVFYVLGGFLLADVVLRLMMIERKDALQYGVLCDEEPDSEGENRTLLPAERTASKSLSSMILVLRPPILD